MEPELLFGELERTLRVHAGELEPSLVDGDDSEGEVVLRDLEPVLDRDFVREGGVRGCVLPAPGPELDPGETPVGAGGARLVACLPLSLLTLEHRASVASLRRRRE